MTMELIEGESLRGLLHAERRLSPSRAVSLMLEICAGVGAAHARGVIHRDLEPENVIVLPPDDQDRHERVSVIRRALAKDPSHRQSDATDFARTLREAEEASRDNPRVVGSRAFMAAIRDRLKNRRVLLAAAALVVLMAAVPVWLLRVGSGETAQRSLLIGFGDSDKKYTYLTLWDVQSGKSKQSVRLNTEELKAAFLSDDAKTLKTIDDKQIRFWDVNNGELKRTLKVPSGSWSPDGRMFVTGDEKSLKFWQMLEQ